MIDLVSHMQASDIVTSIPIQHANNNLTETYTVGQQRSPTL